MRRALTSLFAAALALGCQAAHADQTLSGSDIKALLDGAHVREMPDGDGGWSQRFSASGATEYVNASGERSSGAWGVDGDRYCSVWPPSSDWECYTVRIEDDAGRTRIIWITPSGFETPGYLVED